MNEPRFTLLDSVSSGASITLLTTPQHLRSHPAIYGIKSLPPKEGKTVEEM